MPLLLPALLTGLPGAAGRDYPETVADAAAQWASAMESYVAGIVPPSTTASAALQVFEAALIPAFSSQAAALLMESAFATFAVALGGGMAAAGFASTPPPAPVGFAALFVMPPPATRDEGIQRVAALIDTWMHTGIATLLVPPFTPQPWA